MILFAALVLIAITQSPSPAASPSPSTAPSPAAVPSPPTAEAVVAVVQQTPAFAADSGRTGLQATAAKPLGVGDRGYFVEIQWTDKDGAAHTGLAVVAPATVQGIARLMPADPWELVQVLEDKTLEGVAGELKRARLAASEAVAIGDLRTIISAELLFAGVADGAYGELRCLNVPADCVVGVPGETLLEKTLTSATEKNGYRRTFHPGARIPSARAKGSPSPFLRSFAYTAVPISPGETGTRGFCGDNTGRICVSADGAEPPVAGGACATPCTELKQ